MRVIRALISFVIVALFSASVHSKESDFINGALCLIRVDNQLLLVEEVITGKLSLPGGAIETGEDPRLTAQRETWEETGLSVSVRNKLGKTHTAYIYDCIVDSTIIAFDFQDAKQRKPIPVWFAPHYSIEVKRAHLIYPSHVSDKEYRYPLQWPLIRGLYTLAKDQPVQNVSNMLNLASSLQRIEISLITSLQSWVNALSENSRVVVNSIAKVGEQISSKLFITLVFTYLVLIFGGRFALKAFLLAGVSGLVAYIIQIGFALPRPFEYLPQIRLGEAYGFSFPDIPAVLMACLSTIVIRQTKNQGYSVTWLVYFVTVIGIVFLFSELYLGSQYLISMFVGGALGGLLGWNFIRIDRNAPNRVRNLLDKPIFWFVLALCTSLVTYVSYSSYINNLTVSFFSLAMMISFIKNDKTRIPSKRVLSVNMLLVVILGVVFNFMADIVSFSPVYSLLVDLVYIPLVMVIGTLHLHFANIPPSERDINAN